MSTIKKKFKWILYLYYIIKMGAKKKEGDANKGKEIFMTQCASCHSMSV
jgi:cytochrome c2